MIIYFVIRKIFQSKKRKFTKIFKRCKILISNYKFNQKQIINFIQTCKKTENDNGAVSSNIFEKILNKKYQFLSGPYSNLILKLLKYKEKNLKF